VSIPARVRWPAIVIGALTLHALAWLAVVYLATSNPSYAVEDDYYAKALRWDASRDQERANAALGWRLDISAEPAPESAGEAAVEVALADPSGSPLDGAEVSLTAFHNSRAGEILRVSLHPAGAGRYRASLPMVRNGLWELRVTARRGPDLFTHRETRHLVVRSPRRAP
jgi:nitrogen fixation protein FixH